MTRMLRDIEFDLPDFHTGTAMVRDSGSVKYVMGHKMETQEDESNMNSERRLIGNF